MNNDLLAVHAKSFYWASFFLSKDIYKKCSAVYNFCRTLDDIADDTHNLEIKKKNFLKFKENFSKKINNDSIIKNMRDVIISEKISENIVYDLFDGVESDLASKVEISSKKDLVERYEQEGSVFLFNKKILKNIGFYDEKFFLYFEEIDLFLRCKKKKLKVFFATNFKVKHNRASSISVNKEKIKNLRAWHYMWSMFYCYKKNYSFINAISRIYILLIKDILMMFVNLILINKL